MKTPIRQVIEFLYSYDISRGKTDLRLFLHKMLEEEKKAIIAASNNSYNKYIVNQIEDICADNKKMFGENYFTETYKGNDAGRNY